MATYYPKELGSRLCLDSDRSPLAAVNADYTGHVKTIKIILAVQLGYNGKDTAASAYRLEWRNETDNPGGAFTPVGAATEVSYAATSDTLVDENAVTSAEDVCTNQDATMTWQNGYENVNDNTAPDSGTFDLGSDCYTEFQWALDLSNGHDADQYTFQMYNVTAGAAVTDSPCDAQITLASGSKFMSILYTEGLPIV